MALLRLLPLIIFVTWLLAIHGVQLLIREDKRCIQWPISQFLCQRRLNNFLRRNVLGPWVLSHVQPLAVIITRQHAPATQTQHARLVILR